MPSPPWTVLAYAGKWAAIIVAVLVVAGDDRRVLAAGALLAVALVELLRGSRAAWTLLVVVEVVALGSAALRSSPWWVLPLSIVALGLLVVRPTREHIGALG